MKKMVDFSEVYMQLGKKEGRVEGRAEGRVEVARSTLSTLAAIGNSQCTIQMALQYIKDGFLKIEDTLALLPPSENKEIQRLLAGSGIQSA